MSENMEKTGRVKNRKDAVLLGFFVIAIVTIFSFIIALPFVIVLFSSTPFDLYVEPEYISGILTASSIIFGLWAFSSDLFERGTSSDPWSLGSIAANIIFVIANLIIFVVGVIFVLLSVLSIIPVLITLCMLISSFIFNCLFLVLIFTVIHRSFSDKAKNKLDRILNIAKKDMKNAKKEKPANNFFCRIMLEFGFGVKI